MRRIAQGVGHISKAASSSLMITELFLGKPNDDAQQDAGDELPPRLSARSVAATRARRSRSTLRFRRQSLSFALGTNKKSGSLRTLFRPV
jgi:hypothetical protein